MDAETAARFRAIEQRLRGIPSRWQAGRTPVFNVLKIIGGNTISDGGSGTQGIKKVADVSEVPSVYDPDVTSSFIDGIGRAWLYIDGVIQAKRVLVVHDVRSVPGFALLVDDMVIAAYSVSIPLDSDPAQGVTAWVPYVL